MWVRSGECNRCGECCKGNPFDIIGESNDNTDDYCPLFKWVEENVGHCTNRQHPYYLRGCNTFPEHPSQIADKPNCSYRFEWVSS